MKILSVSDEECPALWDYYQPGRLKEYDLILSCGDLSSRYLSFLVTMARCPVLYVHGNHDAAYAKQEPGGCICVDDEVYVWKGLRVMGLGGSIRYNRESPYQYTEQKMRRRIARLRPKVRRLGGIDLLLTHSPAKGLNDGTDLPHQGFDCFNSLLEELQPQWFVHGHIHLSYDCRLPRVCSHNGITVINATERYTFEVPDFEDRPIGKSFSLRSFLTTFAR